jgi:hypothetical protein
MLSLLLAFPCGAHPQLPQPDEASIIRGVDAAVKARLDAIASYTVTEHYAVYRGGDETHPAAEMTVKTTYQQETGKSYQILSETGSDILRKYVLDTLLENEKRINEPANRAASWITTANYEMKLQPGGPQRLDGRDCYVLSINPKEKASNLIIGSIWVDTKDESIVQLQGVASKSVSIMTSPAQVMRQYASVDGFAEATRARAVSESHLLGQTIITIEYKDYDIRLQPTK